MQADIALSQNCRASITNDPRRVRSIDGRSEAGRRRRDLIDIFVEALGGPDTVTDARMVDVVRAAELIAVTEATRAALLKGNQSIDLLALSRIEGTADRAVRRLGIKLPSGPKASTLQEHLAKRAAKRAGERSGSEP
jgi:hypothetical protein